MLSFYGQASLSVRLSVTLRYRDHIGLCIFARLVEGAENWLPAYKIFCKGLVRA